jgi:hypothetical protein
MAKPSNNNPPCAGEPETVEDTVEEPEDRTFFKISSDGVGTNELETIRLQKQFSDERKKTARAEGRADAAQKNVKKLKILLESCNAAGVGACKKLKGEIAGLKIKEKFARDAQLTSSKIVDDARKQIIGSKANCIRDLRKEIFDLKKEVNETKALKGKVDRLKADILHLVQEKNAWVTTRSSISKEVNSLRKKINDQVLAKYAHQQKMAEIALKGKEILLAQEKQRRLNLEAKNKAILEQRKEFQTWTYEQRGLRKEKDLQRKEEIKEKKTKKVADRLQIVLGEMLRTNRLNGGALPTPGLRLEEVSIILLRVQTLCFQFTHFVF